MTGGLIDSQEDTWGITEALTIGQSRLFLRIGASHGVLGVDIVESLWQDFPSLHHRVHYVQELWERRLQYEHAKKSFITRVSRCQQDRLLLRWAWDSSIIGLTSSSIHNDELVSIEEDHPDLPFGFHDSLMVWET